MRIAFFGGSFDPPHIGHLHIARAAAQRLGLDRVLLAPTGRQPLKSRHGAPFAQRLRMVQLLVEGEKHLEASAIDAPVSDEANSPPNYTVDTLARLRPELPLETELFSLAGADSFLTLHHWRSPEALLRLPGDGGLLDGWILAARPGFSLRALPGALPPGYRLAEQSNTPDMSDAPGQVLTHTLVDPVGRAGTPLSLLPDLDDPAAATDIRKALAGGEPVPYLTPSVERLIREHRLYRAQGPVLR